jgi:hypothetical protein
MVFVSYKTQFISFDFCLVVLTETLKVSVTTPDGKMFYFTSASTIRKHSGALTLYYMNPNLMFVGLHLLRPKGSQ